MNEHFGDLLKQIREDKDVSISSLSHYLHIPDVMLIEIEENLRPPSKYLLEQLAANPQLDIPYSTLRDWRARDLNTPPYLPASRGITAKNNLPDVVAHTFLPEDELPCW